MRHESGSARNTMVAEKLANLEVPRIGLYNLNTDPGELHDLSAQFPKMAEKLEAKLDEIVSARSTRAR